MKYVVSGSRRVRDYEVVKQAIEAGIERFKEKPTLIIEGGQRSFDKDGEIVGGVDWLAKQWAKRNRIPVKTEKAKWSKYRYAAGPIRNREMADKGDVLIAIPDIQSKGTRDMITAMVDAGKPYFIAEIL